MKICLKCFTEFPTRVTIDGKERNLQTRQFCLVCSPFGQHNTKQLNQPVSSTSRRCPRCHKVKALTEFYSRRGAKGAGTYCKPCVTAQTVERQRALKVAAVQYAGGKCTLCDYQRCIAALEFHHLDPSQKDPNLSRINSRTLEKIKDEINKCILVCANCHREIHAGIASVVSARVAGVEPT